MPLDQKNIPTDIIHDVAKSQWDNMRQLGQDWYERHNKRLKDIGEEIETIFMSDLLLNKKEIFNDIKKWLGAYYNEAVSNEVKIGDISLNAAEIKNFKKYLNDSILKYQQRHQSDQNTQNSVDPVARQISNDKKYLVKNHIRSISRNIKIQSSQDKILVLISIHSMRQEGAFIFSLLNFLLDKYEKENLLILIADFIQIFNLAKGLSDEQKKNDSATLLISECYLIFHEIKKQYDYNLKGLVYSGDLPNIFQLFKEKYSKSTVLYHSTKHSIKEISNLDYERLLPLQKECVINEETKKQYEIKMFGSREREITKAAQSSDAPDMMLEKEINIGNTNRGADHPGKDAVELVKNQLLQGFDLINQMLLNALNYSKEHPEQQVYDPKFIEDLIKKFTKAFEALYEHLPSEEKDEYESKLKGVQGKNWVNLSVCQNREKPKEHNTSEYHKGAYTL